MKAGTIIAIGVLGFLAYKLFSDESGVSAATLTPAQGAAYINSAAASGTPIAPTMQPPAQSPDIKATTLKSSSGSSSSRYSYDPVVKTLTERSTGNSYQTTGKVTTLATGKQVVIGVRTVK